MIERVRGRFDFLGFVIEESRIIFLEAGDPDVFLDLFDADILYGEIGCKMYFHLPHTNSLTGCGGDGFVMEGVIEFLQATTRTALTD